MSEQDQGVEDQETASEAPQETAASSSSATHTPKNTKGPKGGKKRGRQSLLTEAFWAELRELYESGDYSQRDLAAYARSRGIKLSQPRIARKAGEQGWIKGVQIEQIRSEAREQIREEIGDAYRRMLETHAQQGRLLQGEGMQHVKDAHEQRKHDPNHKIPAALLRQITSQIREAQEMEARAIGFDYKEGRPFRSPDEAEENQLESMRVDVMSPAEEAKIREQAEKEVAGMMDGDE